MQQKAKCELVEAHGKWRGEGGAGAEVAGPVRVGGSAEGGGLV